MDIHSSPCIYSTSSTQPGYIAVLPHLKTAVIVILTLFMIFHLTSLIVWVKDHTILMVGGDTGAVVEASRREARVPREGDPVSALPTTPCVSSTSGSCPCCLFANNSLLSACVMSDTYPCWNSNFSRCSYVGNRHELVFIVAFPIIPLTLLFPQNVSNFSIILPATLKLRNTFSWL